MDKIDGFLSDAEHKGSPKNSKQKGTGTSGGGSAGQGPTGPDPELGGAGVKPSGGWQPVALGRKEMSVG